MLHLQPETRKDVPKTETEIGIETRASRGTARGVRRRVAARPWGVGWGGGAWRAHGARHTIYCKGKPGKLGSRKSTYCTVRVVEPGHKIKND